MTRLLEDKTAIVYGAAGSLGGGVARTFARHTATGDGGVILHLTSGSSGGQAPMMGATGSVDAPVADVTCGLVG